jgi:hypothetical protein
MFEAQDRSLICYDVAIMMARTQITLEPEIHRRARQRASDLGVSLAEYFRRLVNRDLSSPGEKKVDVSCIFDLGRSSGSNIAKNKDRMIAEALQADLERGKLR